VLASTSDSVLDRVLDPAWDCMLEQEWDGDILWDNRWEEGDNTDHIAVRDTWVEDTWVEDRWVEDRARTVPRAVESDTASVRGSDAE